MGCAKYKWSCALTILDQVQDLANLLANAREVLNEEVQGYVNELKEIADFALGIFADIRSKMQAAWAEAGPDGTIALIMATVYTFSAEKQNIIDNGRMLTDMVKSTVQLFVDFAEGDLSPKGISRMLVKYGGQVLQKASSVTAMFTSNKCAPVSKSVAFTVDDAGKEELIGAYIANGQRDGRPKYVKVGAPRIGCEYSKRQKAWRFYEGSLTGAFSKNLYLVPGTQNMDYPTQGWIEKDASAPVPAVVAINGGA